jgi:type IV pilus assembly protein PilX
VSPTTFPPRRQRGAALIIVLLLLLVMTLLGLSSLRSTLLEERMTGAMFDRSLAFQVAESALREGEAFVTTQAAGIVSDAQARNLLGNAFDCTATGVICESNPNLTLPTGSPVAGGGCAFSNALWRTADAAVAAAPTVSAEGTPAFCVEFTGTSIMANDRLSAEVSDGGTSDMVLYNYRIYARSADPEADDVVRTGRATVTLQGTYVISRI